MGIYFDYDYEDGKEVESWVPCFLCSQRKVLFVEYHIKKGPIYTLLNDEARKLWSGKEVKIVNDSYLICEDCFHSFASEDDLISAILKKKRTLPDPVKTEVDPVKVIENEIEETKEKICQLLDRLGELYERLGRERLARQYRLTSSKEE